LEGPINISRNTAETNIGISSPLILAARRCGEFLHEILQADLIDAHLLRLSLCELAGLSRHDDETAASRAHVASDNLT
jgi:hypothetical protein